MKKTWAIFVFPVLLAVAGVILLKQSSPQRLGQGSISYSSPSATNYWQGGDFVSITPSDLAGTIRKIRMDSSEELSTSQSDALVEILVRFILMNHIGDYEDYLRFRFGAEEQAQGAFNKVLIDFYRKKLGERGLGSGLSERQVLKLWWETDLQNYLDEGNYRWDGIALEKSVIEVATSPPTPMGVGDIGARLPNSGVETINPSFIEAANPRELQKKYGKVTFATLTMPVRNMNGIGAGVYLQVYWHPGIGRWIPFQVGTSGSSGFRTTPF